MKKYNECFIMKLTFDDFCGIIPIFKANFCISISEVKIRANNDFNMVADKIS